MTRASPPPPKHERRRPGRPVGSGTVASRQDVIEAAIRAVRRDGPGVTMEAIAVEAGVTKPVVYRAVGDKEAVTKAVADDLSRRVDEMTRAIVEAAPASRDRIRATTRSYLDLISAERQLFLFVEYGWGAHGGTQFQAMIERAAAPFIRPARPRVGQDATSPSRSRTFAYASVGALRTAAVMWVLDPYCDIDEITEDMTDYLVRTSGVDRSTPD